MISHRERLGDVCEFVLDGTHGSPERTAAGIPVLSATNVLDGYISLKTDRFTSQAEYQAFERRLKIKRGDVLLTIVGTIGRTAVVNGLPPVVFQRSVAVLRPDHSRLDSIFLFHSLRTNAVRRQLEALTNQSAQAGVYLSKLKTVEIALPELPKQKRIAAILDKADAIRRKREQAIKLADEFLRSLFLDMFGDPVHNPKGWPVQLLGQLLVEGPQNGLYRPSSDYGTGTPIVRIDSFDAGAGFEIHKLKRLRIPEEIRRTYALRRDDLLINRVNSRSHLGKSALVPDLAETVVFESNMMRLKLRRESIDPIYSLWFLHSPRVKRQIQNLAKDAVNQASINQQDVKSLEFLVPPLSYQRKFAAVAEKLARLRLQQERIHQVHPELVSTLTHRAFRGEL